MKKNRKLFAIVLCIRLGIRRILFRKINTNTADSKCAVNNGIIWSCLIPPVSGMHGEQQSII